MEGGKVVAMLLLLLLLSMMIMMMLLLEEGQGRRLQPSGPAWQGSCAFRR